MKNLLKFKKGFTLIELLVVIAIIGILAALIIVSLSGARLRAQDTQTKNNVRSLSTALEQYYTDQTSGSYPVSVTQVAFNDAALTGPLATYASGGAGSQIFTGYSGLTTGYITAGGTSNNANYIAAATLRNTTEATLATGTVANGNGEYLTSATGALDGPGSTDLAAMGNSIRAWVVYGPQ